MSNRKPIPLDELEGRFLAKVTKTDTCWIWNGACAKDGYGRFSNGETMAAHRLSYQIFVGAIPKGHQVDHLCHGWDESCAGGVTCQHRRCVNPTHLEAVTQRVNMLRGRGPTALAARRTHCPKGHPYDEHNTLTQGGKRRCRACRQAFDAERATRRITVNLSVGLARLIRAHFPGEHATTVIDRAVRDLIQAGIRDAARQAAGQTAAVPATAEELGRLSVEASVAQHAPTACPTPETHNWGCGCPTDKAPAAAARQALASYMGGQGNDPTLALLLNDYHSAVAAEARAAAGRPAVEQPAEAQRAEAHPPREQWRVELYDPLAKEWAPGAAFTSRKRAEERLRMAQIHSPRWAQDETPVERRLVRETTTWAVEEEAGTWVPRYGRPLSPEDQAMETLAAADEEQP